MALEDARGTTSGTQAAALSYFRYNPAVHDREKPFELLINIPPSLVGSSKYRRTNVEFEDRPVNIRDARGREQNFTLDRNGVCWRTWEGPKESVDISLEELKRRGDSWLRDHYIPEAEAYMKSELEKQDGKALDFVKIFDYRLRESSLLADFESKTVDLYNGLDTIIPALHPHVDQSFDGSYGRLRLEFPEEAEVLSKRRFRIVNLWKPLNTVENWPLTVCDSETVPLGDLIASDLVRRNFVLEGFYARYNPQHQWYYISNQKPKEVTFIKIFDSSTDVAAKFSLHASFGIPEAGNKRRESIEFRALVFDL